MALVGDGKGLRVGLLMAVATTMTACGGGGGGSESDQPAKPTPSLALSGVIDVEAGSRVDEDNADALLSRSPLVAEQSLPAEFLLAGYVSDTPTVRNYPSEVGFSNDFQYFPDKEDRYVAPLQNGLELTLQAFATRAGAASDVRLELKAPDGSTLGQVTAPATGGQVRLPVDSEQTGNYHVSVTSLGEAPMLYILSSSRPETANANAFHWPDNRFAEDEAIVTLSSSGTRMSALSSRGLMASGREVAPGLWAVRRPQTTSQSTSGRGAVSTLDWIRSLRADPAVEHASPNYLLQAMNTPIDEPFYANGVLPQQWHYSLINGPVAWQLAPEGGDGVNVAVLDSGLFRSGGKWHPDLAANVGIGFDAVDGDIMAADPGNAVGDSVYHGTHVAGTVAAAVNGIGGAGVAFKATLFPVRVLGEGGSGTLADLLEGMSWVLGDLNRPHADVVNLSLGGLPCDNTFVSSVANDSLTSLQELINQGVEKGILYVAAAGNEATGVPSCPAALDNVFSVSAVDGAGMLASYSNFGGTIDLAAPGGDASRDGNGDGQADLVSSASAATIDDVLQPVYLGLQGTSMAAPHVAGVFALMKGADATLDNAAVEGFLLGGDLTTPPCDAGCVRTDQLGYGILNAAKSVQASLTGNPPELLASAPSVVNLASEPGSTSRATIELAPLGNYTTTITNLSASNDWFSVTPSADSLPMDVTYDAPLQLSLTLDPDKLTPGVSSRGSLQVTYDSDTENQAVLTVPVIGQQITDQQARDAGRHFILLVEPEADPQTDTYRTVAQAVATVVDGQYRFEFIADDGVLPALPNEVPPGSYFLVAGSDLDNDGLICHAGEACAEYPVSGLRQEIRIEEGEPVTGLRMTTSYSRPSFSASSTDQLPRSGFTGYRLMPENGDDSSSNLKAVKQP